MFLTSMELNLFALSELMGLERRYGLLSQGSTDDLEAIALSEVNFLDEFLGVHNKVVFGISDSSFMFIQRQEKVKEHLTTSLFQDVAEISDQHFS